MRSEVCEMKVLFGVCVCVCVQIAAYSPTVLVLELNLLAVNTIWKQAINNLKLNIIITTSSESGQ
jgi:hypothetical protein